MKRCFGAFEPKTCAETDAVDLWSETAGSQTLSLCGSTSTRRVRPVAVLKDSRTSCQTRRCRVIVSVSGAKVL